MKIGNYLMKIGNYLMIRVTCGPRFLQSVNLIKSKNATASNQIKYSNTQRRLWRV